MGPGDHMDPRLCDYSNLLILDRGRALASSLF